MPRLVLHPISKICPQQAIHMPAVYQILWEITPYDIENLRPEDFQKLNKNFLFKKLICAN